MRTKLTPDSMNIYLSAAYGRREEMREVANFFRSLTEIDVTAAWIYTSIDNLNHKERSDCAHLDHRQISECDLFVTFTESNHSIYYTGARHVELGIALALEKRIVAIGPRENVFHDHFDVEHYESFELFLQCEGWLDKNVEEFAALQTWLATHAGEAPA